MQLSSHKHSYLMAFNYLHTLDHHLLFSKFFYSTNSIFVGLHFVIIVSFNEKSKLLLKLHYKIRHPAKMVNHNHRKSNIYYAIQEEGEMNSTTCLKSMRCLVN